MDPAAMMNGAANTASYHHLSEIWQFPSGESTGGLGLRLPQFGLGFGDFATPPTREDPNSDPVGLELRDAAAVNLSRKRRDSEEESVKCVSTSNGGGSGNGNDVNDGCNVKRVKTSGKKNESTKGETVAETSSGKDVEQTNQPPSEPPKQDYIHVKG